MRQSSSLLTGLILGGGISLCLGLPAQALGQEGEEGGSAVLEVEPEKERLECPKEQPALLIRAPHDGRMDLKLVDSADGSEQRFSAALQAGKAHRQGWKLDRAEGTWAAHLHIDYAEGKSFEGTMGFTFYCAPRIEVKLARDGLDLGRGRLKLDIAGPAAKAEALVTADGGDVLLQKTLPLAGKKSMAPQWPVDERGFGGLDLKVFDRHGSWVQLKLTPFALEIPHEEVEFESGKWEIRPSEEPKLQDTLAAIREEIARFPDDLMVPSLYIVGYTDTVGSRADNNTLSTQRARSIGRWFRQQGLKNPIHVQGFGEDILAVETPDETAEPANRRALYILTNVPPPIQQAVPRASWQRLP